MRPFLFSDLRDSFRDIRIQPGRYLWCFLRHVSYGDVTGKPFENPRRLTDNNDSTLFLMFY